MAEPTLSKKRYVPLAEASRISGYTDEYIHRLCRIGKIPCRIMGEKAIVELDALLKETGTILLSGEHVGFIEIEDESRYPVVPTAGAEAAPEEEAPEEGPHIGSIAVVGETVEAEDGEKGTSAMKEEREEKFPSNALPFFSSAREGRGRSAGVHVRISSGEAGVVGNPPRRPTHLSVRGEKDPAPSLPSASLPSNGNSATPSAASGPSAAASPDSASPLSPIDARPSMLPMAVPSSLPARAVLMVFAFGLFVAPTVLGMGQFLNDAIIDAERAFRVSARATLAAVGLSSVDDPERTFPYLTDASKLLSAAGASEATGANGIVVAPLSGSPASNADLQAAIENAFSDPVTVVPDGKDGRTGTIRPTFTGGGGYMYVMVPVRQ